MINDPEANVSASEPFAMKINAPRTAEPTMSLMPCHPSAAPEVEKRQPVILHDAPLRAKAIFVFVDSFVRRTLTVSSRVGRRRYFFHVGFAWRYGRRSPDRGKSSVAV